MKIRPYTQSDQTSLIALWQAAGVARSQNDSSKDIQRKLAVDPELLLIAESEGQLVGSIMGGYEGHRGWVNYLAVLPEFQRQGIASRLMNEIEAALLKRGCPKINLQVRSSNQSALEFYAALGYLDDNVVGLGKRLIVDRSE